MFFTSHECWIAAAVEQRHQWNQDRNFAKAFSGNYTSEDVWRLAGAYRVSRNFARTNRKWFECRLRETKVSSFDDFVRATRVLAKMVKERASTNRRSYKPLSGVSKLLWYRFPTHGFIYDDQALTAIFRIGLVAPFVSSLNNWGGRLDNDPREWNFMIFAASYRKYFWPLHDPLSDAMKSRGRDMPGVQAQRLVDMLLWTAGASDNRREKYLANGQQNATEEDRSLALVGCKQAKILTEGA